MGEHARRLAVLGSPIEHSRSPQLHAAAYRELGLPWDYSRVDVAQGGLRNFLDSVDDSWVGISLTMPLKREVLPYLDDQDSVTDLVGAANTVVFDGGRLRGFNTDVEGARRAIAEAAPAARKALVLGSGATAAAILAALAEQNVLDVTVASRSTAHDSALRDLADRVGVSLATTDFSTANLEADVVASALPGSVDLVRDFPEHLRLSAPLVDVAYDPWPTPISRHWMAVGGRAVSGLRMLTYQALAQVRIFVHGDQFRALHDEVAVLEAMRAAVTVP